MHNSLWVCTLRRKKSLLAPDSASPFIGTIAQLMQHLYGLFFSLQNQVIKSGGVESKAKKSHQPAPAVASSSATTTISRMVAYELEVRSSTDPILDVSCCFGATERVHTSEILRWSVAVCRSTDGATVVIVRISPVYYQQTLRSAPVALFSDLGHLAGGEREARRR